MVARVFRTSDQTAKNL